MPSPPLPPSLPMKQCGPSGILITFEDGGLLPEMNPIGFGIVKPAVQPAAKHPVRFTARLCKPDVQPALRPALRPAEGAPDGTLLGLNSFRPPTSHDSLGTNTSLKIFRTFFGVLPPLWTANYFRSAASRPPDGTLLGCENFDGDVGVQPRKISTQFCVLLAVRARFFS